MLWIELWAHTQKEKICKVDALIYYMGDRFKMENCQPFQHFMNAQENNSYSALPRPSVVASIPCSQLFLSAMASL